MLDDIKHRHHRREDRAPRHESNHSLKEICFIEKTGFLSCIHVHCHLRKHGEKTCTYSQYGKEDDKNQTE